MARRRARRRGAGAGARRGEVHLCDPELSARAEDAVRLGEDVSRSGGRQLVHHEGQLHHVHRAGGQAGGCGVGVQERDAAVRLEGLHPPTALLLL